MKHRTNTSMMQKTSFGFEYNSICKVKICNLEYDSFHDTRCVTGSIKFIREKQNQSLCKLGEFYQSSSDF